MNAPAALPTDCERAFPPHARHDRYFPASTIEAARQRIEACVLRGDGPALVIGAAGVGKTMLLEVTAEALRERLRVLTITSAQLCTRRAMLQAILFGLGLPYRDREEGELRLALHAALQDQELIPHGVALLIDEAQSLPAKLLEELRVLCNLARRGEPVVRPVLFGGPGLEELFAAPELETFNQRLAARCYLSPMTYEETREYVRAHVAAVGGDPDTAFTLDGLDAVFHASDGVPRLASQVSDRALGAAVSEGRAAVDANVVQLAWSDLHQLPAPWHTPVDEPTLEEPSPEPPADTVVEFGSLEDPPTPAAEVSSEGLSVSDNDQSPQREPEWNADQALSTLDSEPLEPPRGPDSGGPFGDDFDEEEIVIDRFASLDAAFHAATPQVTNTEDPELSVMAGEFVLDEQPDDEPHAAAEEPADDRAECEASEIAAVDEHTSTLQLADTNAEEHDLLIVENDTEEIAGVVRPMVRRREYRQLFAQLRRG